MPSDNPTRRIVIAGQCHHHSARLTGIPAQSFFTNASIFTRTQLAVSAYHGFDAPNLDRVPFNMPERESFAAFMKTRGSNL